MRSMVSMYKYALLQGLERRTRPLPSRAAVQTSEFTVQRLGCEFIRHLGTTKQLTQAGADIR
jgi:hypothetical protein